VRAVLYEKEPVLFAHYSGFNSVVPPGVSWHGLCAFLANSRYWIRLLTEKRGRSRPAAELHIDPLFVRDGSKAAHGALKQSAMCGRTSQSASRGLLDRRMRRLLSRQDAVLFLSESERKAFRGFTTASMSFLTFLNPALFPPGIEKAEARAVLGLPRDGFLVLFMGGFSKLKGTRCDLSRHGPNALEGNAAELLGHTESGDAGFDALCLQAVNGAANVLCFRSSA
jgi:hypothetical protein